MDVALQEFKAYDILFIGEPALRLDTNNNSLGYPNHPSWRRVTVLDHNTKVAGCVNSRLARAKEFVNRSGTVGVISVALTKVVGVYLPGDAPLEDLIEDVQRILTNGRVVVLGDFNTHSVTWGAPRNNPRGSQLADWPSTSSNIYTHTWSSGDKESTPDLSFTNCLTYLTSDLELHLTS